MTRYFFRISRNDVSLRPTQSLDFPGINQAWDEVTKIDADMLRDLSAETANDIELQIELQDEARQTLRSVLIATKLTLAPRAP